MQLQNINEKRLRKVYSRLILQAMREGTATRRNISIIYYAEDYEDAPSTIYQRTRLREAIHELRTVTKAEAVRWLL